jgi:acetoacetyl-CoA reductase/3-oxoacyl-[acyl-carrier protein] reductase
MCAARPHLAGHGRGRIVNMVSLAADRGDAGLGEYNAAKAGHRGAHAHGGARVGTAGHHANAIAPGAWTKRGQDYAARDPEGFAKAMAARPIGRLGDPESRHRARRALPRERRFAVPDRSGLYVDGGAISDDGREHPFGFPRASAAGPRSPAS